MEKYFGNAYRGDPGVPHADADRFVNIWVGSALFCAFTWNSPYMWQLTNQFNWHDRAFLFEQYHWKKAMAKNQPYKFQEKRLAQEISNIENDTGFKLRVLAQNYPETPGLAIKDFWQVDDRTIVFVADPSFGNILNFNVGASVDLDIPRSFWSRLAGKYGNIFYWKEKGEDASIEAAVMAISNCLKEPVGSNNCSEIK
ncbi:thylakoid lumenal 15.0 kDa protein 2 chloroplastic [Tripterygium wilfordii]|uniref:Thylakoid lumenal 15.0 kDa protein 2 chloroplastic n=1 Tax=Tripterygium wilfordii TaxID=458696 RepID=A0A7J7DVT8_TRIWF|nr:thylakoid lumenal 15.0 kDa protein 2 chloroplastic [Tripterygium wilfordii]